VKCPRCGVTLEVSAQLLDEEDQELAAELALEQAEDDALFLHDCEDD
jgi:hypothetical protein